MGEWSRVCQGDWTYDLGPCFLREAELGHCGGFDHFPGDLDNIVAGMAFSDVAVAAEELRVGVRAVVVKNLLAGLDGSESGDCEVIPAMVDVCLCTSVSMLQELHE